MSTLGGVTNANTLNHMRSPSVASWLAVPEQLAVGHVKEAFNEEGQLNDEALTGRLETLVESVMTAAEKLRA